MHYVVNNMINIYMQHIERKKHKNNISKEELYEIYKIYADTGLELNPFTDDTTLGSILLDVATKLLRMDLMDRFEKLSNEFKGKIENIEKNRKNK